MLALSFVAAATLWMPPRRFQRAAVCATDLVPFGTSLVLTHGPQTASCRVVGRSRVLWVSPDVRTALGPGIGPLRVRVYARISVTDCPTAVTPARCDGPCALPARTPCA